MGQIAVPAAVTSLSLLTGSFSLAVQVSPGPTWTAGLYWVNTSDSNNLYAWNGSAWVSYVARYLALLTADPAFSGAGGGPAVTIGDLVECADTGYARALVTMGTPVATGSSLPVTCANTGVATFGPFPGGMALAAGWAALVTCPAGGSGVLLYTWANPSDTASQQAGPSQSIQVPAGGLIMSQT